MNHCKFFGAIAFVLCTSPCLAGELTASDIEVVAVTPRSPDVKPYAMAIPIDGHRSAAQSRKEQKLSVARSDSLETVRDEQAIDRALLGSRLEAPHNPIPVPLSENAGSVK